MPRKWRGAWKRPRFPEPAPVPDLNSKRSGEGLGGAQKKRECLARGKRGLQLIRLEKEGSHVLAQSLPQLYRFCFLMTGDARRAIQAFQNTLRTAALLAARGQLAADRLWSFHEARHQCLEITKDDVQAETTIMAEKPIASDAAERVAQLDPEQLAAWICGAPEPQRSALAFFYLNEFSHREMQNLLDVKMNELADLISHGRSQFQAWLNTVTYSS
jgi:DNA-directed RNA polymerase specialized sigma24 family protein